MSIFTAEEIEAQITAYKAALMACAGGSSYRVNTGGVDRTWTSADLPEIRRTLAWLESERQRLNPASRRTYAVTGRGN